VKLTPNISDIRIPARAAKRGGADALSAINTINSITGIDLDTLEPRPMVDGSSTHGGYCGPAVKPIALSMVQQIMSDADAALPLSGIGGVATWRDAVEFLLLGASNVQVCTAVMHYGYRVVEDMADGMLQWMSEKGYATIEDFRGLSLPKMREWKQLNMNYKVVAHINESKCIGCQLCYMACWDGAHQCIHNDRVRDGRLTPTQTLGESARRISMTPIPKLDTNGGGSLHGVTPLERIPRVDEHHCVGCNLCSLVCPVDDCITMVPVDNGLPTYTWEQRVADGTTPASAAEWALPAEA
jgi:dihydropyrimidine dehydrogenase (NAD+) subunit PreA